jgi:hypothetical protein
MLQVSLRFLLFILCYMFLMEHTLKAQSGIHISLPKVGVSTGGLSYKNLSDGSISGLNNSSPGYSLHIEERFSNSFSLEAFYMWGSLAGTGTREDPFLSFETKLKTGGLIINYHFANGYLLKQASLIDPYIGVGLGYINFQSSVDLKDKTGNTYFYWSDGSIRNKDEHDDLAYSAVVLQKDRVAETVLQNAGSLMLPLNIGFTFAISPSFQFQVGGTYNIAFNDKLINMTNTSMTVSNSASGKSQFLYTHIGLNYNFGKNAKKESAEDAYSKVNFNDLEQSDEDHDGVKDAKDKCPETLAQAKVDANGCALDEEKPKSKTQTAPIVHEASTRIKPLEVSKTGKIVISTMPVEYRWADTDGDGKISQAEISGSIDAFFDGADPAITHEKIMKLIDFFFDQ